MADMIQLHILVIAEAEEHIEYNCIDKTCGRLFYQEIIQYHKRYTI